MRMTYELRFKRQPDPAVVWLNSHKSLRSFGQDENDIEARRRAPGVEAGGSPADASYTHELFCSPGKRGERFL